MSGNEIGQLMYLVLLGAAILGWFIAQNRMSLGKTAQQALVWALIFVGVIAAAGLWGDIRRDVAPRQSFVAGQGVVEVPRSMDGHFYLTLGINGKPVRFVVDTGATFMVLSQKDAERVGIDTKDLAYLGSASTANGMVQTARVRLDQVTLGEITDTNVGAFVNRGPMEESLLGMSYLQRFERLEIVKDRLVLTR